MSNTEYKPPIATAVADTDSGRVCRYDPTVINGDTKLKKALDIIKFNCKWFDNDIYKIAKPLNYEDCDIAVAYNGTDGVIYIPSDY